MKNLKKCLSLILVSLFIVFPATEIFANANVSSIFPAEKGEGCELTFSRLYSVVRGLVGRHSGLDPLDVWMTTDMDSIYSSPTGMEASYQRKFEEFFASDPEQFGGCALNMKLFMFAYDDEWTCRGGIQTVWCFSRNLHRHITGIEP